MLQRRSQSGNPCHLIFAAFVGSALFLAGCHKKEDSPINVTEAGPSIPPSIEDERFLEAVQDAHDQFLNFSGNRLGFHSLKVDAGNAGAQLAIRVYGLSSWRCTRVTIYRHLKTSGTAGHPVFSWRLIYEDLGIIDRTDNRPLNPLTVVLDQNSISQIEKILSANEVAISSLPVNGGGILNEDRGSFFLEIVNGDSYLCRYRVASDHVEGPLEAVAGAVSQQARLAR